MTQATFSTLAINTKLDAVTALLDGGVLELHEGSSDSQEPLARLHFARPAFHEAVSGTARAYPLKAEEAAPREGTARRFVALTTKGQLVLEGSVGTAHADLVLSSVAILVGTRVTISSFTLTEPKR